MKPYLDDILELIRMFLSIIIIWLSTARDGHIALKGFILYIVNPNKYTI